jgi:hypothetical protein
MTDREYAVLIIQWETSQHIVHDMLFTLVAIQW